MRRYAILYSELTNNYSIIAQELGEPDDRWVLYQPEIEREEVAQTICDALNNDELRR